MSITIELADDAVAVQAGVSKWWDADVAYSVAYVRASLFSAQATGTPITIDFQKNGTSLLSSPLMIPNGAVASQVELPSATANELDRLSPVVLGIGDGTAMGLKVTFGLCPLPASVLGAVPPPPPPGATYVGWDPANANASLTFNNGIGANSDTSPAATGAWVPGLASNEGKPSCAFQCVCVPLPSPSGSKSQSRAVIAAAVCPDGLAAAVPRITRQEDQHEAYSDRCCHRSHADRCVRGPSRPTDRRTVHYRLDRPRLP